MMDKALSDLETLKTLLADQSAMLLEQQRNNMSDMMSSLREEMKGGEAKILGKVQAQQEQLSTLQAGQASVATRLQALEEGAKQGVSKEVLDRLQRLETSGASSSASTQEPMSNDRHRYTLIFGGWQRDTSRKTIVQQVHDGLRELQVASLTDFPAWCTGPRKSMSLMTFRVRQYEDYQGMRDRMAQIVGAVNRKQVVVTNGGRMWAGFSKPRAERARGSHAAYVRRVIRALNPEKEADLEPEYSTGSMWLGEHKFCSATVPADGLAAEDVEKFDNNDLGAVQPWIDVRAIADCLGTTKARVREELTNQKRY